MSFLGGGLIKYYKLDGINIRNLLFHSCRRHTQKHEAKVLVGLVFSEGSYDLYQTSLLGLPMTAFMF